MMKFEICSITITRLATPYTRTLHTNPHPDHHLTRTKTEVWNSVLQCIKEACVTELLRRTTVELYTGLDPARSFVLEKKTFYDRVHADSVTPPFMMIFIPRSSKPLRTFALMDGLAAIFALGMFANAGLGILLCWRLNDWSPKNLTAIIVCVLVGVLVLRAFFPMFFPSEKKKRMMEKTASLHSLKFGAMYNREGLSVLAVTGRLTNV